MKFAAFLGVKDEFELVDKAINHLRAIGVDLVFAWDLNSRDGTLELLLARGREDAGLKVIQGDDADYDSCSTFAAVRGAAAEAAEASYDWLLFLDADEFWLPASGRLADCADLLEADVLSVRRFNVPLLASREPSDESELAFDPLHYEDVLLVVEPIPNFRDHLHAHPETPWSRGVPIPKIMARPQFIESVEMGMHDLKARAGQPLRRATPKDLIIAHRPFTTKSRFARKIANIRKFLTYYDEVLGPDLAWHWRRWLEIVDRDGLDQEFNRNVFDQTICAELRQQGTIVSAAEFFRGPRAQETGA